MAREMCRHCHKRYVKRSGLGTCGRTSCIAAENRAAMRDHDNQGQRHDTGAGMKVKVDGRGSAKTVVGSGTKGGKHFYRLAGGGSVEITRAEIQ